MKVTLKIPKGTISTSSQRVDDEIPPCPENLVATFEHENLEVSDGDHTFEELYEHRYTLWIALCRTLERMKHGESVPALVWRSELHSDGNGYGGYFLLGITKKGVGQLSYHIPMKLWEATNFAETLERGPEWDGHTASDVLTRLMQL